MDSLVIDAALLTACAAGGVGFWRLRRAVIKLQSSRREMDKVVNEFSKAVDTAVEAVVDLHRQAEEVGAKLGDEVDAANRKLAQLREAQVAIERASTKAGVARPARAVEPVSTLEPRGRAWTQANTKSKEDKRAMVREIFQKLTQTANAQ